MGYDAMSNRRNRPANRFGCKPDHEVCVARGHDEPLVCKHGCTQAKEHKCVERNLLGPIAPMGPDQHKQRPSVAFTKKPLSKKSASVGLDVIQDAAWIRGFANALALASSVNHCEQSIAYAMRNAGLSVKDLQSVKTNDTDLRVIKLAMRRRRNMLKEAAREMADDMSGASGEDGDP